MAEYTDKKYLDRKFQIDMMCLRGGTILDTQKIIDSLPTADVIERYEYEYLKKENRELAIKYDNAMNMVINEQENVTRLRSKIDKAIEEIKNITPRATIRHGKTNTDSTLMIPLDKVIEILKRNIGD